jgi:uncharacterized protein
MKWYKLAADGGNIKAMYNLGTLYDSGYNDIPPNYEEAMKWYKLAAAKGEESAQACIGSMYEHGRGVKADLKEAIKWYKSSIENGSFIGKECLEILLKNHPQSSS